MGEAVPKDDESSAQTEAVVAAAARLQDACSDLAACLRRLPGLTERRAAALLVRAAAVSGRLSLKEAIRILDAAWEGDQEGPLCGEPRVVPETPERSPLRDGGEGDAPVINGVGGGSEEETEEVLPNGVVNGSAGEEDKPEPADAQKAGQAKPKRKKPGSDSDDSAKSPAKPRTKKKREKSNDSDQDDHATTSDVETSPVQTDPCDESEPGLVIAKEEPLSQPADSEEAIVKMEPEVAGESKTETATEASRIMIPEDDSPMVGDSPESPMDEPASPSPSPECQNEQDRLMLLASSGDEDADNPGADAPAGEEPRDSESTVVRSGSEAGGGSDASSSDSASRGGRRLRERAAKEEKRSDSASDWSDPDAKKKRRRRRRDAKKHTDSDADSDRSTGNSRARRRRREDSEGDSSDERSKHDRRRRDRRNRHASNSSANSGSDRARRSEHPCRRRRRRRPRGPPEPSDACSVLLTRLPPEIEREAAENGFVKITKRAKKRLSEEALQVRRLANVASLLRSSMMKGGDSSSEDSDEDDSDEEAQKKAKKAASKSTKKYEKKKRKTLKDMSDGESGGRPSGDSDDSDQQTGLVPMEENEFDREQLLASDSGSDADSEPAGDDDHSDFVPSDKDKKKDKKKKVKKETEESGEEKGDNEDESKSKEEKKQKKKAGSEAEDNSGEEESKKDKKRKKEDDKSGGSEDDKNEDRDDEEDDKKKKKKKKADDGDEKDEDEEKNSKTKSDDETQDSEDDDIESKKENNKKLSKKVRDLLNGKMSATDSSEEDEKMKEKIMSKRAKEAEKAAKEKKEKGSDKSDGDEDSDGLPNLVNLHSSDEEEVTEKKRSPRKKRMRVVDDSDSDLCVVDSDAAEEDEESAGPSKKRSRSSSSSSIETISDSGDDFAPPKKTRSRAKLKRIRRMSDDSVSSSGDDSVEEVKDSQGTPGKGGRKNIRHIREAEQSTKEASQAEQERRKRIEDKRAMCSELFRKSAASDEPDVLDKLVLDFDAETKKSLVSVHKNFVKILKPHQVDGVKFMFDSTIESVARFTDESNQDNAGCILAHCMGLGKTLQVVVLLHTLLESKATREKMNCALVVCPKNTVQNWVRELKSWQKKCRVPEVDVVDITFRKDNYERSFELEQWQTEGGVCVLSYDMFKRFCGTGGKKGYVKKQKDRFQKALIDPGPDIVVCDEGHLLKNPRTAAFKSLNQTKCRRRVILTGTPLQNNLREYHTMVEFVKPRLLGSESEFSNRFIRPIENGSAVDAQSRDVKLMKRRSHVLHKLLNSVVQRRDYNVLMPFLPPKLEFTLMVKLSELQTKLYESYLERARSSGPRRRVLADFQALSRVWTHPRSIQMKDEQDDEKEEMKSEREMMERFVANDDSTTEEEDSKDGSNKGDDTPPNGEAADDSEWWRSCIPEDMQFEDPSLSGKLMLLDQLLIKCENIGDKLLVFSQSLFSLNLIEEHLERLHKEMQRRSNSDKKHPSHVYFGTWKAGYDYFRLDGSTPEDKRQQMCDRINKASNERARLMLISTKAGGLGINLVGANRVVIFDASWNPTADSQAIFRVYRFGQVKPSYVYRFIAQGCMEEKIYDRQISKLSLSCRVVDEQQVERHFSQHDVEELYEFEPERKRTTGLIVPKDDLVLMELVSEQSKWVSSVHGHDSLLQNVEDEELNADEQRAAWEEYENDRRGIPNMGDIIPLIDGKAIDKATVIQMIKKDNPQATDNEVLLMIPKAIQTLRAYYYKKQQQEMRAREEQYRQALQQQRQAMFNQHAMQAGAKPDVDMSTYSQLLELMAQQRVLGSSSRPPPPAHGRSRVAIPSGPASAAAAAANKVLSAHAAAAAANKAVSKPPSAHSGHASSAPVMGRQRTAHQPGPAHSRHLAAALQAPQRPATNTMRALAESAAASRRALEAGMAGASGAAGEKKSQDGGKGGDKPTKPPDVVDIT